jgi:hypothetical protein
MSIVERLVEKLNVLPLEKQRELLAFADSLVQAAEAEAAQEQTDWKNDPFVGMWKDREDMADSVEWVRQVRRREWNRLDD